MVDFGECTWESYNAQKGILHHLNVRFDTTSARDKHDAAVTQKAEDEALENIDHDLYVEANICELLEEIYVLAYVGLHVEPLLRAFESVCDVETEVLVLINDTKPMVISGAGFAVLGLKCITF